MLPLYNDQHIRTEVYKGTLMLLIQQAVDIYNEANSYGIALNIEQILKVKLGKDSFLKTLFTDTAVQAERESVRKSEKLKIQHKGNFPSARVSVPTQSQTLPTPGVIKVQSKRKLASTRGKWSKNRNIIYKAKKGKKNTKKKIEKQAEMKKQESKIWQAGGPRPIVLLKTIGLDYLLQVGMFWYHRDEAELAITEHAELEGRRISFIREGKRLRALCGKNAAVKSTCAYGINVRFGEVTLENEYIIRYGWHLTKFSGHDCTLYREKSKTMYSYDLLARALLPYVVGISLPTVKQCQVIVKGITLREVGYYTVWGSRKILEEFVIMRGDSRAKVLADIVRRLQKDGHYCQYGTISGEEMRKVKREVLLHKHRLKYKNAAVVPRFDETTIDYSMIDDEGRYLSWIFFASKVAIAQALIMDEPNSEADFCFGHSVHQGVIGLELTLDADHKVVPRAFMWSAADESTKVWTLFLEHLTLAYPTLNTDKVVLKVDGAKGAWTAVHTVTKRHPFRDHKHRGDNAQVKFGVKGRQTYLKIAKCRDKDDRDALIAEQSQKFKDWTCSVPFEYWSAAAQTMVHGQYETSCVEGMNKVIKYDIEVRGADPVTALLRWVQWDRDYFEQRKNNVMTANGVVTPRMKTILQRQSLALTQYTVGNVSADKRKATVTHLRPNKGKQYCSTFTTELLLSKDVISGMMATCTCKRHIHGILCDHVAAHIEAVGDNLLEDFVHVRDTMIYYRSQYPLSLPSYPHTSFNDLRTEDNIFLPVIASIRRGRPRKSRFISFREQQITKAKKKLKRKIDTIDAVTASPIAQKRLPVNL